VNRPTPPPTPHRPTRIALWGAAAVVAGGIAAIVWLSRGEAGLPGAMDATSGSAPAPAVAPGTASEPPASAPSPAPAPPAAPKEWSQVPVAARISDLGPPLARDVYDGLQRARAALEPCFVADERDAAARPRVPEEEDAWGAAIVTLQLEGRPGELVVVNAPLQSLGTSSMLLVDCCERVLRGFRMPAPKAVPGKRYQLQYQLTQ